MFLISSKATDTASESAWKKAMAVNRIEDPIGFAEFMLGKTSRTFALNIQVLPAGLRRQVLLAYLFCRMADTLEDDAELPADAKIRLLEDFRALFPLEGNWEHRLALLLAAIPEDWARSDRWDRLLVVHAHWIIPQLNEFSQPVSEAISACVREMCDGMIDFTAKPSRTGAKAKAGDSAGPVLIETMEDLDRYCYFVAGTVGNMLCDLFSLHSPLIGKERAAALKSLSVSFGLGLQLTNILKDIHDDRLRNVSYIPLSLLAKENLTEQAFLAPEGREGAARIMAHLIGKAKTHLEDALEYSCLLPRMEPRLRLFCLWPLFMAAETIALIAENMDGIQDQAKLKISRTQVSRIVRKTSLACWSNRWLHALFRSTLSGLENHLERVKKSSGSGQSDQYAAGALGARS